MKWESMTTAPRDGTEVLGYRWYKKIEGDTYEFYNVVYWEKGLGWCLNGGDCIKFPVTHWMPLPEPPNVSRETPLRSRHSVPAEGPNGASGLNQGGQNE